MGTRAVYTFRDENNEFHVYKHWDNSPRGAAKFIEKSLKYAWELPRFEADDFSAAFIRANKPKEGGDIRITHHFTDHGDLDFRYEIYFTDKMLCVDAYRVLNEEKIIFSGTLENFKLWSKK